MCVNRNVNDKYNLCWKLVQKNMTKMARVPIFLMYNDVVPIWMRYEV